MLRLVDKKRQSERNQMKELLWFQVFPFNWNHRIVSTVLISFARLKCSMIHICAITHHRPHTLCMLTVPMSAEIDDYRKRKEIESRVNEISGEEIINGHRPLATLPGEICNESEIRSLRQRASASACFFPTAFENWIYLNKIGIILTLVLGSFFDKSFVALLFVSPKNQNHNINCSLHRYFTSICFVCYSFVMIFLHLLRVTFWGARTTFPFLSSQSVHFVPFELCLARNVYGFVFG